jgi:hypothetical protein
MKKLFLLSGIIALASFVSTSVAESRRPAVYTMIDSCLGGEATLKTKAISANWPAIFAILDSMKGVISVNEYRTPEKLQSLLYIAVEAHNFLAAEKLLKQYKANPNMQNADGMTPLAIATFFATGDVALVKLLLKHGANPYIKDKDGYDAFYGVDSTSDIYKLLKSYKQ